MKEKSLGKLKRLSGYYNTFLKSVRREHIGAFSAQSAFFLIMSFIPMAVLTFLIMNISKTGGEQFFEKLEKILEELNVNMSSSFLNATQYSNTAIISVTTLVMAWSAGKAFKAITEGLHSVLHISESRNYVLQRLRGLFYSVAFAVMIACLFFVGVFGETLNRLIIKFYPPYGDYEWVATFLRKILTFSSFMIILIFIYRFVPDWSEYTKFGKTKVGIKCVFCGSFTATAIIYIYTLIFSCYIRNYPAFSGVYGSLTTLICIMLWLYVSMYILILGFKFSCFLNYLQASE